MVFEKQSIDFLAKANAEYLYEMSLQQYKCLQNHFGNSQ